MKSVEIEMNWHDELLPLCEKAVKNIDIDYKERYESKIKEKLDFENEKRRFWRKWIFGLVTPWFKPVDDLKDCLFADGWIWVFRSNVYDICKNLMDSHRGGALGDHTVRISEETLAQIVKWGGNNLSQKIAKKEEEKETPEWAVAVKTKRARDSITEKVVGILSDEVARKMVPVSPIELRDGSRFWHKNEKLHREDGPAIEWGDGTEKWFLDGVHYTEQAFWQQINEDEKKEFKIGDKVICPKIPKNDGGTTFVPEMKGAIGEIGKIIFVDEEAKVNFPSLERHFYYKLKWLELCEEV